MRRLITFCLVLSLFACRNKQEAESHIISYKVTPEIQEVLDTSQVRGVVVIYDASAGVYYTNDTVAMHEQQLPASTFKIPNTIIGLETGILSGKKDTFYWDGSPRAYSVWEGDLSLQEAFRWSCVPCYQELARDIGVQQMNAYLARLEFGHMDVTHNNIDNFWLVGASRISPVEQIDFLKRLYYNRLPISDKTHTIIKDLLHVRSTEQYMLSGKTGLVIGAEYDIGWFVGYVEKADHVYFFATQISPATNHMSRSQLTALRERVTTTVLRRLHMLK